MKRLKAFLISLVLLVAPVLAPVVAQAAAPTPAQTACSAIGTSDCKDTSGGPSINKIISAVISLLSLLIGIIAVIMIIVGGLKYVTSNGSSEAISSAKNTIIYAVIGLIIAALAQALVQFVLNRLG